MFVLKLLDEIVSGFFGTMFLVIALVPVCYVGIKIYNWVEGLPNWVFFIFYLVCGVLVTLTLIGYIATKFKLNKHPNF